MNDPNLLSALAAAAARWADPDHPPRADVTARTLETHPDFTFEAVTFAVNQTMSVIADDALAAWQAGRQADVSRTVGVLHAGNIPLGDLQDVLAVLLAGHRYLGVVSSRSPYLLPAFLDDVRADFPDLNAAFTTFDNLFETAEAVIATGSDETKALVAERCDAAGIPPERRLLRGHRYSLAVVDGRETEAERERLAEDVLLHEGFGCRNVAVVLAPDGLSPDPYLDAFALGRGVYPAPPTTTARLKMPTAFLKATKQPHAALTDGSLVVSKGPPEPQIPGHLRWADGFDLDRAAAFVAEHADTLQVVAVRPGLVERFAARLPETLRGLVVELGDTQRPPLDWTPDGVDTLGWLAAMP